MNDHDAGERSTVDAPKEKPRYEVEFFQAIQRHVKDRDWQALDAVLSDTRLESLSELGILTLLRGTEAYRDQLPSWKGLRDRSAVVLSARGVNADDALSGLANDPSSATRRDVDLLLGLRRCRAQTNDGEVVLTDDRDGDLVRWADVENLLRSLHVSREILPDPQVAVMRRLAIIRNLPGKPTPGIRCCKSGFNDGQMTNYALEAILAFEKAPVPMIVDPEPDPACDACGGPLDQYGECVWIAEERERQDAIEEAAEQPWQVSSSEMSTDEDGSR